MASRKEKQEFSSDDSSGDSLDYLSERFDPLKALYSEKIIAPAEKCRVYDNLARFESALKKSGLIKDSQPQVTQKSGSESHQIPPLQTAVAFASRMLPSTSTGRGRRGYYDDDDAIPRRFLPHQMAIKTTGQIKKKHFRNLFTKMEQIDGPLAALQKYRTEKTKVKIYTRKQKGIRGYTIGFIIAFDAHWNLLLDNAYEVWKRRKYKFSENKAVLGKPVELSDRFKELGITLPKLEVKSLNRKYVECRRTVNQIMIKGEQIVLIHPISNDTK